jgi:hypothetical protein
MSANAELSAAAQARKLRARSKQSLSAFQKPAALAKKFPARRAPELVRMGDLQVTVPPGTAAEVPLPDSRVETIELGRWQLISPSQWQPQIRERNDTWSSLSLIRATVDFIFHTRCDRLGEIGGGIFHSTGSSPVMPAPCRKTISPPSQPVTANIRTTRTDSSSCPPDTAVKSLAVRK